MRSPICPCMSWCTHLDGLTWALIGLTLPRSLTSSFAKARLRLRCQEYQSMLMQMSPWPCLMKKGLMTHQHLGMKLPSVTCSFCLRRFRMLAWLFSTMSFRTPFRSESPKVAPSRPFWMHMDSWLVACMPPKPLIEMALLFPFRMSCQVVK